MKTTTLRSMAHFAQMHAGIGASIADGCVICWMIDEQDRVGDSSDRVTIRTWQDLKLWLGY